MKTFFERNRGRFIAKMKRNSVLIMFAGELVSKRGDEMYPFTPKRNFYYMTGIDQPKLILMIHKIDDDNCETTLFLERFDEVMAKWVGAVISNGEAEDKSGIENFEYIDEFHSTMTNLLFSQNIENVYIDMENRYWNLTGNEDIAFANELKARFPAINIINAYYVFSDLRIKKEPEEIEIIQKAIDITREGIYLMMKNARAGMMEYQIEAYFDYVLKNNGVMDRAFATIAAAGKNATILHYVENNTKTKDGDLILFDLGASLGYYSADISRTFPINGKFTDRQKELYNIVLAGQEKVIEHIKPGILFSDLNQIIRQHYYEELTKIGLIETEDEVSDYYFHNIGHMLGLETHDIGRNREGKLEVGMVLTVEPGLYIEEEGIGIRIEDDVVVTDTGCDVLSKDIIKTVDEIEAFMKN